MYVINLIIIFINSSASTGEMDILNYLIDRGCDPDACTKLGRSPLSKACWNGRIEVVERLIASPNVDINR